MEKSVVETTVHGTKTELIKETPKPYTEGAYTIFPACGCGCGKKVKVANALVRAVGDADWFRPRHHPNVKSSTVTFRSKEEEEKND